MLGFDLFVVLQGKEICEAVQDSDVAGEEFFFWLVAVSYQDAVGVYCASDLEIVGGVANKEGFIGLDGGFFEELFGCADFAVGVIVCQAYDVGEVVG